MARSTPAKSTPAKKSASRTKSSPKKAASKKTATKKAASKKAASKNTATKKGSKKTAKKKWSKRVNETSDAMDLKQGVFKSNDPKKIATSVKRSAKKSNRIKASSYQSAMSMLNFYVNRGGKNLPASKKKTLEKAKDVLRELYGREKK